MKTNWLPRRLELQIALSVAICLITATLYPNLQLLAAGTGALMCCQDAATDSLKVSLIRLKGMLLCGVFGVAVVLLNSHVKNVALGLAVITLGLLLCLMAGRLLHMSPIACRVGCISFMLVVASTAGGTPSEVFGYAMGRLLSSLYGALIAVITSEGAYWYRRWRYASHAKQNKTDKS